MGSGEPGQTLAVAHNGLDDVKEIERMKTLREQLAELAPAQYQLSPKGAAPVSLPAISGPS